MSTELPPQSPVLIKKSLPPFLIIFLTFLCTSMVVGSVVWYFGRLSQAQYLSKELLLQAQIKDLQTQVNNLETVLDSESSTVVINQNESPTSTVSTPDQSQVETLCASLQGEGVIASAELMGGPDRFVCRLEDGTECSENELINGYCRLNEKITAETIIPNLYTSNRLEYEEWKEIFTILHPKLNVYDAGSYVRLNNGQQIVTFSYFASQNPQSAGQMVVLFNQHGEVIQETEGLQCQTIGDVPVPRIESVMTNSIIVSCVAGDAGVTKKQRFEIQLSDFSFRQL